MDSAKQKPESFSTKLFIEFIVFQILYHAIEVIIHSLINFQCMIDMFKIGMTVDNIVSIVFLYFLYL